MRKLLYCTLVGLSALAIASCEDNPKNPGDYSLQSELEMPQSIISLSKGTVYPLNVVRSTDTTYAYHHTLYDTLKDVSGDPILNAEGKLQITERDTVVMSKVTAKFVEYEPITLQSFEGLEYDTLAIAIRSNANWYAPINDASIGWYENLNATTKGGGDCDITFRSKGRAKTSKYVVKQEIHTLDSTKLYRMYFKLAGYNE